MPTPDRPDFRLELPLIGITLDAAKIPDKESPQLGLWRGEVGALIHMAFRYATLAVGEEFAKELWAKVPTARRRGRPAGSTNLLRDFALLGFYAAEADDGTPLPTIPRVLGAKLYAESAKRPRGERELYGNSADAIAQRIRRLVKDYPREMAAMRKQSKP